jgi:hypothetical protein
MTNLQLFSEKYISDLINRTYLISRHRGNDVILPEDILFTLEKEFDYSFGNREVQNIRKTPTNEHIDKLAEISRQR